VPDRIYIELTSEEVETLAAELNGPTQGWTFPEVYASATGKLCAALEVKPEPGLDTKEPEYTPCLGCPDCQPESGEGEDWSRLLRHADEQAAKNQWLNVLATLNQAEAEALRRFGAVLKSIPAPEEPERPDIDQHHAAGY